MKSKGPGDCARQLFEEIATVKSLDVALPVKPAALPAAGEAAELRLRVVTRPDKLPADLPAELLAHLGLELARESQSFAKCSAKNHPLKTVRHLRINTSVFETVQLGLTMGPAPNTARASRSGTGWREREAR